MELVISIDDKIYEEIKNRNNTCNIYMPHAYASIYAIENGTPLLKGHGRLIDESKITKCEQVGLIIKDGNITRCLKTDAPTIIEADKS